MQITDEQILIFLEQENVLLQDAKEKHRKYLLHVHGKNTAEYLIQINGLEDDTKIKLRKKLSRSNKDLFADILNNTTKIFTANGGTKTYELSESLIPKFEEKLNNIAEGLSLEKWLQNIWLDKLIVDPNGVILIEAKEGEAYPTYKSVSTIINYKQNGQSLEWIIFDYGKNKDNKQIIRVYDDVSDRLYIYDNKQIILIPEEEYKNEFGRVPAVLCSSLVDPLTFYKTSPIDNVIELADEYLRDNSVKTLYKYHHMYPLFWMYKTACPKCNGTGEYKNSDNNVVDCPQCNGTGYAIKKDVSDVIALKPPYDKDSPIIAPNLAGYIAHPADSINVMTNELKLLRDMAYFAHWGTIINREDKEKTAFEVGVNLQPVQDKLDVYSSCLEVIEKHITDLLGQAYYKNVYKGCKVNRGRQYIIYSADDLMKKYNDTRKAGANVTALNDLLEKYYDALFRNDSTSLEISKKLIYVEPFVHNTIDEVGKWQLSNDEYLKKVFYQEWLSTMNNTDLYSLSVEQLKVKLSDYVKQKSLKDETKDLQ